MSMPNDTDSLIAAWEAIGPSEPLHTEVQGLLLAYFKHVELHGEHSVRIDTPGQQQLEQNSSPPSRFVRQPRANIKAPTGPAEVSLCSKFQEKWLSDPQKEDSSSNSMSVPRGVDFENGTVEEMHFMEESIHPNFFNLT